MAGLLAALGLAALLLGLHAALALFTPVPRRALRVLMYHRVSAGQADRATVPVVELERQLGWLRAQGFALVTLEQVVAAATRGAALPDRPVLLTFDDGTSDADELLAPLLARLGAPAALFAVPGFAGQERDYDGRRERFLSMEALRRLPARGVAVGLHTTTHVSLKALPPDAVEEELRRCGAALAAGGVPFLPALAYPFGAYPRKDPAALADFLAAVRAAGVSVAFRIGNRVNPLPLAAPLELTRTEIRGDEPFWVFARKVRRGRLRGFA